MILFPPKTAAYTTSPMAPITPKLALFAGLKLSVLPIKCEITDCHTGMFSLSPGCVFSS